MIIIIKNMIKIIGKLLNINNCTHANVDTNKPFSYCPDCGKLIKINWYVIKCACCGKKRVGIFRGNKAVPFEKFCTNCGTEDYIVEKLEHCNYFDMNYAIAKKEEETGEIKQEFTETWVEEVEILKNILCLPHNLN